MIDSIIAMATINPLPIIQEPCPLVSTPVGTMCAPKVSKSLKVYGIIRTQYLTNAKRICHGMAGNGYQLWDTKEANEWLCVKEN